MTFEAWLSVAVQEVEVELWGDVLTHKLSHGHYYMTFSLKEEIHFGIVTTTTEHSLQYISQ